MQKEIRNILLSGAVGFLVAYLILNKKKECPKCGNQYPTGLLYTSPMIIPSVTPPPPPPPPLPPNPNPPLAGMDGKFKSFFGNKY
jgi:hypothetical protein